MRNKNLIFVAALLLMVSSVFAITPSGATVTDGRTLGPIANITAGTTNVTAGQIKEATLETNMSTMRWAGIFGNVSGKIQLGDDISNIMFDWDAKGNIVYVSENTPTWSNLSNTTASALDGNYSYLITATSEKAINTFTGSFENIGSNLFNINTTYASTNGPNTSIYWKTYALTDGSNFVFAGKVQEDTKNFRNQTVDFQMIVPEDGLNSTATIYSVWVELI